jgi:voltage-gated sodium channel
MELLQDVYLRGLNFIHLKLTGRKAIPDPEENKKDLVIDISTWHKLEENFGLTSPQSPEGPDLPTCERPEFECFIGVMVMINAITMALELDFSDSSKPASENIGWIIVDVFFCATFAGEIVFRIKCLGLYTFFKQPRYVVDFALVAFNIADTSVTLSGTESTGLESFSALRILRLIKIMKLMRLVSHVKELSLIATGLASALKSLQWVSLLLAVVIFVMAVMFKILMGRECASPDVQVAFAYRFMDVDPVVKCEEFWGTVIRSMYTLYQITTLESWSEVLVRPIFDARPEYVLIILIFQLVTTLGLLNIVVAAIVDGTMNSVDEAVVENQNRKHITAHLRVLRDIFIQASNSADSNTEKTVTRERLLPVLLKPDNRRKLLLLNIEFDDPSQIWRIVDSDENGSVDIKDFTTNLMRMRGTAKAKDLLAIRSQIYRVQRGVETKVDQLKSIIDSRAAMPQSAAVALPPPPPDEKGTGAVSLDNSALERVRDELRDEIGKLSGQFQDFQDGLGRLRSDLSKDISGRLGMFENNLTRLTSTLQMPLSRDMLSAKANDLYVQPGIPREQELPTMPAKPCCNVLRGNDREVVTKNTAVVALPAMQPPPREGGADPKLATLLTGEHKAFMRDLEERHQLLLNRLNLGFPRDSQDEIVAALASEPKALEYALQKPQSTSVQTASTQTESLLSDTACHLMDDVPLHTGATQAFEPVAENEADKAGSCIEDEEADRILEAVGKEIKKKEESGGFAQALENQKKAQISQVPRLELFVHGPIFEGVFAFLITANACIMALQVQYRGIDVGVDLEFPGARVKASDSWVGADDAFAALELGFGIIFVLELLFKIVVLRFKFIRSAWNFLDTVIVGGWIVDSLFGVSAVLNPMMLRLFRLVKLLRVAKLFKSFQAFDSLSILIGSMKASVSVLFWSVVVLFTAQLGAALLLSQGLESFLTNNLMSGSPERQAQHQVYEYFGTFTRSFVTTTQLTLGNWVPVCRLLHEHVSGLWAVFIVFYIIFIHFAAIKVISAVFIVETQKVASTDEELLILQKERQITRLIKNFAGVFKEIDSTGDGLVDYDEFQNVIHDHRVLTWLAALDLDIEQCEGMFALLNGGDGKISFQEFVKGVQRLKGDAKAIDLTMLMNRHADLTALVISLTRKVESIMAALGSR